MKVSASFAVLATVAFAVPLHADPKPVKPPPQSAEPRKIYGHYMGCWPVGFAAIQSHRNTDFPKVRHDADDVVDALGGRFKTFPLMPPGVTLTPQESADLEIRRGIGNGLDGFAIDAWAGGEGAMKTMDALFAAAEAGDYPFEITICLDPSCLPPGVDGAVSAIRYLLDTHGNSSKLARRDGKPLILGYASLGVLEDRNDIRGNPEQWHKIGERYREVEKRVGQPLFFQFEVGSFFNTVDLKKFPGTRPPHQPGEMAVKVAGALAKDFGAVGLFIDANFIPELPAMSKAVRAEGSEWAPCINYQYDNCMGSLYAPPGTDILRRTWESAIKDNATLMQFVTWNDYGEHTSLAPTLSTGYTIGEINALLNHQWKTGQAPASDWDRIYATYRRHAPDAIFFPFNKYRPDPDGALEVLTVLPKPGLVRLPGRTRDGKPIEYEAPAGMHVRQFPLDAGPVIVEVIRDGKVDTTLKAAEPISDRPYRTDNTLTCASTEDERRWKKDFPDRPYPVEPEYGDADGDGLPNWFEMYWFGNMADFATATDAESGADPDSDGKTNLEEHLARTDPTRAPPAYPAGTVWKFSDVGRRKPSFNPDRDLEGTPVWRYQVKTPDRGLVDLERISLRSRLHGTTGFELRWKWQDEKDPGKGSVFLPKARYRHGGAVTWVSPVDGVVDVTWETTRPDDAIPGLTCEIYTPQSANEPAAKQVLAAGKTESGTLEGVPVKVGQAITLVQSTPDRNLSGQEVVEVNEFAVTLKEKN